MKWRNDEVEEALQQLEEVQEIKEENKRLNNTIQKLKTKQGDKESNIEVDLVQPEMCRYTNRYFSKGAARS